MKRKIIGKTSLFFVIVVLPIIAALLYLSWLHSSYVDRAIPGYTGIKNYELLEQVHSEYDWFAKLGIKQEDAEGILKKYPFHYNFRKKILAGKLENPYVSDCPACWYYLEDKGHGPYGYRLYILLPDKKRLIVYENFGD